MEPVVSAHMSVQLTRIEHAYDMRSELSTFCEYGDLPSDLHLPNGWLKAV